MSTHVRGETGAPASRDQLSLMWELDLDYLSAAQFAKTVVERGLPHYAACNWSTERHTLDGLYPHAVRTFRDTIEKAAVLDLSEVVDGDCLAHISLRHQNAYLQVAGDEPELLAEAEAWVRELYPESGSADGRVAISFWANSDRRRHSTRTLELPLWSDIARNYPSTVRAQLGPLFAEGFRPASSGQLLLWHGVPGTGKTSALRALARSWSEWCRVHYITDPEAFFGTHPRYMLDLVLDEDDDEPALWRLLVLEDTGELLAADAKARTGQGVSRLLNVVDGMIGQGLRLLVLLTTNERLGELHPAVSRPGRCASAVEFAPFGPREAGEWLDRNGCEAAPVEATLAELFAIAAGAAPALRQRVGFA